MTRRIYVDRSRYEQYGRCPRSRYEQYHRGGMGIDSIRKPLPLAVGGSVHVGLAELLRLCNPAHEGLAELLRLYNPAHDPLHTMAVEDNAVAAALADFAQYARVLELPDAEAAALNPPGRNPWVEGFKAEDFQDKSATVGFVRTDEIDDYLYREQSALVEALVRAYARRRLRPLLEQFEVLEVEREGEWRLSSWDAQGITHQTAEGYEYPHDTELWFMSRPDALLRERESNQLYLLSYKTAASWDVRKARDAEHDMQGMSEGIEVERRLHDWWMRLKNPVWKLDDDGKSATVLPEELPTTVAMAKYLESCDSPPRIHAVRYEYILKGERWKDKELSARFNVEMRSQKSHLIRQYVAVSVPQRGAAGYSIGDYCWSWDYVRDDGSAGSLAWQNWKSRAVWEVTPGGVKRWIDALDDAAPTMSAEDSTMGLEPRLLGYKCDAQAVGVTREHPLDAVFVPPVTVYRSEDELRDLVDQMEAVERRIAEGVAAVEAATDEGDRRHQLNVHFPMVRRACEYPTTCQFSKGVCYASAEARRDPLASGLYKIRTPNHPQEARDDKG